MDEILRLFAFRTAIPFGYLLFVLAGAGACFVALLALVIGLITKRWLIAIAGVVFLSLAGIWVVGNLAYEHALDLNPYVTSADLVGTWVSPTSRLELKADGTFRYASEQPEDAELGVAEASGTWKLIDASRIEITDAHGEQLPDLLVISFRAKLHIIRAFVDPDEWDGEMGLVKRIDARADTFGSFWKASQVRRSAVINPSLPRAGLTPGESLARAREGGRARCHRRRLRLATP